MSYTEAKDSGRRLTGLAVVVAFHVVLIYALVHGLARNIVQLIRPPLETKIIEEIKPPPPDKPPPPPPSPKLVLPPLPYIAPPDIPVQRRDPPPTITGDPTAKPTEPVPAPARPAPPAVPAPPREPVRMAAVIDVKACDKPSYPAASLRANEVGVVQLNFLIDLDGKVLESKIERSSGYRRLDEAARNGLGLCRFRPATVDGKPERSWARMEYEWKID